MANIVDKVKNEMTFENILSTAIKTPGVKVNREKFGSSGITVGKKCPKVL